MVPSLRSYNAGDESHGSKCTAGGSDVLTVGVGCMVHSGPSTGLREAPHTRLHVRFCHWNAKLQLSSGCTLVLSGDAPAFALVRG